MIFFPYSTTYTPPTIQPKRKPMTPTFPQFNRLPLELRRQIWREAMPDSRTVCLKSTTVTTPSGESLPQLITKSTPIPAVFHVCAESRTEAFMYYRAAFSSFSSSGDLKHAAYIDFSRDTIYCSFHMSMSSPGQGLRAARKASAAGLPRRTPPTALQTLAEQEGHQIRHLAVHFGNPFTPYFMVDVSKPIKKCAESLLKMERLEEVTLVWVEESSPSNYFMEGKSEGSGEAEKEKVKEVVENAEFSKEYIFDLAKEADALQKVLKEAEKERPGYKAPNVKVLCDL